MKHRSNSLNNLVPGKNNEINELRMPINHLEPTRRINHVEYPNNKTLLNANSNSNILKPNCIQKSYSNEYRVNHTPIEMDYDFDCVQKDILNYLGINTTTTPFEQYKLNKQRKGRFEHNFSNQQVNHINKKGHHVRPASKEKVDVLRTKEMLISGNNCTVVNNQF